LTMILNDLQTGFFMKLTINRDDLLQGLQFISGVIERRQNMPILGNVLMTLQGKKLQLTASDSEIELSSSVQVSESKEPESRITVSGRKLIDILRTLSSGESIQLNSTDSGKITLLAGKSRFTLATLPTDDFPLVSLTGEKFTLQLEAKQLLQLLTSTAFAMAEQDVRYYMNGLYVELTEGCLTAVATDGHRLTLCKLPYDHKTSEKEKITGFILPRKAVLELIRILNTDSSDASMLLNFKCANNSIRCETDRFSFHSRLIEGNFPNYQRVVPKDLESKAFVDKNTLKQTLQRMLILAQDKYPAVRLLFKKNDLSFSVHNAQNEEADDEMAVDYTGKEVEIAFNIHYLLEALGVLPEGTVQICFSKEAGGSVCVLSEKLVNVTNVIMPMTL
jgi:DNA polymerase-3 subunit beta